MSARYAKEENEGARSGRSLLLGAIVAVSFGIATLAACGRYAFIWKAAVIPVLLVTALLSRRLGRFIDDWGIFLGLVILFDFLRGFVFAVVTHWQLPVYMQYAIAAERWLCGGHVMPVVLQRWRAGLASPAALDRALTVVHSSHFVFFLLFGLAVWMLRPEHFRRYAVAVVALVYVGAVLYLIVPTVPPWMAAEDFGVLSPVVHISAQIYNTKLPVLQEAFDVNPIAAMPSLHAALPTLCVLIAAEVFGWWALPLAVYLGLVCLSIVYLGEHYLVDVLAGALLATAVWALVPRREALLRRLQLPAGLRPVLAIALLIIVAEGVGQVSATLRRPFEVTPSFAARELDGKTPLAHLFLGRFALERGELARARHELEQAAARITVPAQREAAARFLARTAYRQGDRAAVIAELAPRQNEADLDSLVLLARAYLDDAQTDAGETLLHQLVVRFPEEPEPLYWLARHDYQERRLSSDAVRHVAEQLEALEVNSGPPRFSTSLLALVEK